jgi:hypothetical protein
MTNDRTELVFRLKAVDEASGVFKKAGEEAEKAANKAGGKGGGGGGGGVLTVAAGLAVANQAADMAVAFRDFANAERDAATNGTELSDKLAGTFPIVGKIASVISDWSHGIDRAAERSKEMSGKVLADLAARSRAINGEIELIGLGGLERQKRAIEIAAAARQKALGKEKEEQVKLYLPKDRQSVAAGYDREIARVRDLAAEEIKEAERVQARERELANLAFETDTRRIRILADLELTSQKEGARVAALRNAGQPGGADAAQINKDLAEKVGDTQRATFESVAKSPGRLLDIIKAGALKVRELNDRAKQDREYADQAEVNRREQVAEEIKAIDVSTQAERLRIQGRAEDAALLELKAANDRQIAEIERAAKLKLKAAESLTGEDRKTATAEAKRLAKEETDALNARTEAQAKGIELAKQYRFTDRAAELRARGVAVDVAGLQQRAALGDGQGVREAERRQIEEEFKQKLEDVDRQLRDKALTPSQREELQRERIKLWTQETIAQGIAANRPGSPLGRTGVIDAGFTTGAGANLRERLESSVADKQLAALREIVKKAEEEAKAAEKARLAQEAYNKLISGYLSAFRLPNVPVV